MDFIRIINLWLSILFLLAYGYQFFFIAVAFFKRKPRPVQERKGDRYAFLIAARNEEAVIGHLVASAKAQDYPAELLDIYVAADNCTDATAAVAREAGAIVFERQSDTVGKGYVMDFMLKEIEALHGKQYYEGYFVIDADNVLDPHFVSAMHRTHCEGYEIITCYRNTKNFGDNWISSGYGLWFLREARYLNYARYALNTSCAVSGTGYMFTQRILDECGGWHYYMLTEDIEFTVDNVVRDKKIGYCADAVVYDEQPVKFSQSWSQRMRWVKGNIQVFAKYGWKLLWRSLTFRGFANYDMMVTSTAAAIFALLSVVINAISFVAYLIMGMPALFVLTEFGKLMLFSYGVMFLVGIFTTATEWKQIHCSTWRKILTLFTFPLFMLTYIPIAIVPLFTRVKWKPIKHTRGKDLEEITKKR